VLGDMVDVGFAHPFPRELPEVTLERLDDAAAETDMRELRWHFIVPEPGEEALWAIYDHPPLNLTSITRQVVTGPARVHDVDGVEIRIEDYSDDDRWTRQESWIYGRLTDRASEFLATIWTRSGRKTIATFLDESFDADWGASPRRVADAGRFEQLPDGSVRTRSAEVADGLDAAGAGVWQVSVGGRTWRCLRVLDIWENPLEHRMLMEGFLSPEGRTVICRRFNGTHWGVRPDRSGPYPIEWDTRLPRAERLTIDGNVYVHWYTCVSAMALV